jgi:hypothetical protein
MAQYGTTLEQIGKIAMAQRENALNNPQALFREPMSYQDYVNSRMISDPIRLFDCVMPCSGAECVILASEEKAEKITNKLVYLVTDAEKSHFQVANMLPDKTTFGMKVVGSGSSAKSSEDIDLFEIYDDYPIAVMIQIEDFGYCKKGEGGKFVEAHDLTYKGDFPVNTGGGELSVGQAGLAGGFLHIVEALRQLRGEAEGHQVKKAERALVTGIGWLNYGRNSAPPRHWSGKEKVMAEAVYRKRAYPRSTKLTSLTGKAPPPASSCCKSAKPAARSSSFRGSFVSTASAAISNGLRPKGPAKFIPSLGCACRVTRLLKRMCPFATSM